MLDAFRDPMWQFIGAISGIGALMVAIVAIFVQRRRKELSYEVLSNSPVLSVQEEIEGKLVILFEQQPVKAVQLLEVKLANSGNQPITSSDFETPITLEFGEKSKILTGEVTGTATEGLMASISVEQCHIALNPLLLNRGDSVTIRVLVANYEKPPTVGGRVVGVSRIRRGRSDLGTTIVMLIGLALTIIGLATWLDMIEPHPSKTTPKSLFFLVLAVVGYVMMAGTAFRRAGRRVLRRMMGWP